MAEFLVEHAGKLTRTKLKLVPAGKSGKRALCLAALLAFAACATKHPVVRQEDRALAVAREAERLAAQRALWPGFDPLSIPLAIYDGERTYLFRHPAPPAGFSVIAGAQPVAYAYEGRHPAMTANSSAEIGGTMTATLLADSRRDALSLTTLAAVALHEAFHVFQRGRHPGWAGNEGDLLLYPFADARLLSLRRLETEALRRALAERDDVSAACRAQKALSFRRARFAGLEPAFVAYERATELNEGLATYVELMAKGATTVIIPPGEFDADEVRLRTYAIGPAFALLLDRLRPGWPAALEADDRQSLDELLEAALKTGEAERCDFTAAEIDGLERAAREDAAALVEKRTARRSTFDARPGWRVVVQALTGQPLWPQGFDPLNVEQVDGGLLHTRFLRLGNDSGQLEAIDGEGIDLDALTESIGPHPLFNGVQRVVIAGLAKPEVEAKDGVVSIRGPGLTASFKNASVRESGTEVLILLESSR